MAYFPRRVEPVYVPDSRPPFSERRAAMITSVALSSMHNVLSFASIAKDYSIPAMVYSNGDIRTRILNSQIVPGVKDQQPIWVPHSSDIGLRYEALAENHTGVIRVKGGWQTEDKRAQETLALIGGLVGTLLDFPDSSFKTIWGDRQAPSGEVQNVEDRNGPFKFRKSSAAARLAIYRFLNTTQFPISPSEMRRCMSYATDDTSLRAHIDLLAAADYIYYESVGTDTSFIQYCLTEKGKTFILDKKGGLIYQTIFELFNRYSILTADNIFETLVDETISAEERPRLKKQIRDTLTKLGASNKVRRMSRFAKDKGYIYGPTYLGMHLIEEVLSTMDQFQRRDMPFVKDYSKRAQDYLQNPTIVRNLLSRES